MQGVLSRRAVDRPIRRRLRRTIEEKSSKRALRSHATSERILDAAEELFARHGIHGVTMREIADRADVDTALLHYYFDSKQGVFNAVFDRRADVLNALRMEEMDRYEAECSGHYELEGLFAAYLRPTFRMNRLEDQGWRNFCAFIANLMSTSEFAEMFAAKFDPPVSRFVQLLRKAMPEAQEADLYWAYHMFSGSIMAVSLANGMIEHLSDGQCHAEDFDAIEPRLARYSAEGFRAVCLSR